MTIDDLAKGGEQIWLSLGSKLKPCEEKPRGHLASHPNKEIYFLSLLS